MRFVKFTLIGLLGITLTFISLGFFHSSFQFENQIEVDASIEKSYASFVNDSLKPEWLEGYLGKEVLSGKRMVPGARFLVKFKEAEESVELIEVLKDAQLNEKYIFDMQTDVFDGTIEVYFEGDGQKTVLKIFTTIKGSNIFYRSMFYLLKGALQKQSQTNYNLLKVVIEKQ
jgi:hypothetical protein